MKKRIILILVVLGVLTGIAGGVWWYIRRSTGWRLLSRAQVAVEAGNYDEAIALASEYTADNPNYWSGYYWKALACIRSGKYGQAREVLKKVLAKMVVGQMDPDKADVYLLLADTYAHPARQTLSSAGATDSELESAGEQLRKANEILGVQGDGLDALVDKQLKRALADLGDIDLEKTERATDVKEQQGRNFYQLGMVALRVAGGSELPAEARRNYEEACDRLLEVVRKDPQRRQAARNLVDLCIRLGDSERTDKAREAVLDADDPPPVAAARLIIEGLRTPPGEEGPTKQRIEDACGRLDDIIERHPDQAEPKVARARVALRQGNPEKAEKLCQQVLDRNARDRFAVFFKARALQAQGRRDEAERILWELRTNFRDWPEARLAYARALLKSGKKQAAGEELKQLLDSDPDNAEALYERARLLREQGSLDDAFTVAQDYYDAHPDHAAALGLLVDLAIRTEQPTVAAKALGEARGDFADRPADLLAVAQGYRRLGNADAAREAFGAIVRQPAKTLRDTRAKAQAYVGLGQTAKAERLLTERYEKKEEPVLAYDLGQFYMQTGRFYQAAEMFQTAVNQGGARLAWKLALARALFEAGELQQCDRLLEELPAEDPGVSYLRFRVKLARGQSIPDEQFPSQLSGRGGAHATALAYLASGQIEKCIKSCEEELKTDPRSAPLHWILGRAYLQDGQDDWEKMWRKAIELQPGRFSFYRDLAREWAASGSGASEIRAELKGISGARTEFVEMACGWVLDRTGRPAEAAALYRAILDQPGVAAATRQGASLALARALARAGQADEAIELLDRLTALEEAGQAFRQTARFTKVEVLAFSDRRDQARTFLARLGRQASEDKDVATLGRVAASAMRIADFDQALEAVEKAQKLRPDDPGFRIRKGAVLTRMGRLAEAAEAYDAAIGRRPNDFRPYVLLAQVQNRRHEPASALATVERLKGLGRTGHSVAGLLEGRLLASWGLHAKALECFEDLAGDDQIQAPRFRYRLATALVALGSTDRAREILREIPSHAPEYPGAQQLLARLAEDVETKLRILGDLLEARPKQLGALVQRLEILQQADRPAEVVEAYRAFRQEHARDRRLPAQVSFLALRAMLAVGQTGPAADLARELHQSTGHRLWRTLEALIRLRAGDAQAALKGLPSPGACGLHETAVGLCAAIRSGKQTGPWTDRLDTIKLQPSGGGMAEPAPMDYRLLAAWAAGDHSAAEGLLDQIRTATDEPALPYVMVASAESRPTVSQAARLLAAMVAQELGLRDWGAAQAMEVLRSRPTCQIAASLAVRSVLSETSVEAVLALLQPDDCLMAKALKAALLMQDRQFEKALALFSAASEATESHYELALQRAQAMEQAGRLEQAEAAYRRLWERWNKPVPANNAAYVLIRRKGDDPDALAEAVELAEKAVDAAPAAPAFQDTLGWALFLHGQTDRALSVLRRAVKGLPDSVEVHSHLGRAEAQAGNRRLARWHLEAAVQAAERRRQEGICTEAEEEAAEAAREALERVEPVKT